MQIKFAYQLIFTIIIVNNIHEIKNNEHLEFIRTIILNQQFKCYSQIEYKGIMYKKILCH